MRRLIDDEPAERAFPARDVAFGVAVLIGATAHLAFIADELFGIHLLDVVVVSIAVAVRSRFPWQAPLAAAMVHGLSELFVTAADVEWHFVPADRVAAVVLVYTAVRWPPIRTAAITSTAVILTNAIARVVNDGWEALVPFLLWPTVALAAIAMRYREALITEEHRLARLHERSSLEDDLRASITAHMEAVAQHAEAASSSATPEEALSRLAEIERNANLSVDEMRRIVGILRRSDVAA